MDNDWLNNEREVLARVAEDDQRAFGLLMDRYSAVIYSHILSYVKNAGRAEEITQDIFVQVWKHRRELPAIDNFPGYIYTITRNRAISAFRQRILKWEEADKDELESTAIDPEKKLELRQLSEILRKAIELLPPRRREVFSLSRFEGLTYDQIAAKLGISKSAVNQHIVEALIFLRTHLRDQLSFLLVCLLIEELV